MEHPCLLASIFSDVPELERGLSHSFPDCSTPLSAMPSSRGIDQTTPHSYHPLGCSDGGVPVGVAMLHSVRKLVSADLSLVEPVKPLCNVVQGVLKTHVIG